MLDHKRLLDAAVREQLAQVCTVDRRRLSCSVPSCSGGVPPRRTWGDCTPLQTGRLPCSMLTLCCADAQGKEYWRRERLICSQMLAAKNQTSSPRVAPPAFTAEDVHCISAAKSFDYRVRTEPTYCAQLPKTNFAQTLAHAANELIASALSLCHVSSA